MTPESPTGIDRRLRDDLAALIDDSGLPDPLRDELRRLAVSRADAARVQETVEELIDHYATALEQGQDVETALHRAGSLGTVRRALERGPASWPETGTGRPSKASEALGEIRSAAASLLRAPLYAVGNVLTLALGIAAAVTLFALFDAIVVRPLPFPGADRLHELREVDDEGGRRFVSYPNFADVRERTDLFSDVLSTAWGARVTVQGLDEPVQLFGLGVSRGFFRSLGVEPVVGRSLSDEEHAVGGPGAAMVSEEVWRTRLGAPKVLDDVRLEIAGQSYPVVGVVPAGFRLLEEADLYLSHERFPGTARGASAYQVVVRLREGVSRNEAEAGLQALWNRLNDEVPADMVSSSAVLLPLQEQIVGSFRSVLTVLFGASLLVVLLASSDVGASMVARGRRRRGEIALRRSLGASRWRLVVRQLAEALLVSLPAVVLGMVLAWGLLAWLRGVGAEELPRIGEVGLDLGAAAFASLLAVAAVGLSATLAIRQALGVAAARVLRETATGGGRRGPAWAGLIAAQVAVAFAMLAGAGLLARSLGEVLTENVGFDGRGVIAAHVQFPSTAAAPTEGDGAPHPLVDFHRRLEDELASRPDVGGTAVANYLPFDWGIWIAPVVVPEAPEEWVSRAGWRLVSSGYFELLDIPLLAGTTLPPGGRVDGVTAVVVNRSLARALLGSDRFEDLIGRTVRSNMDPREEWLQIVGVAEEARHWRAEPGSQPELFLHFEARPERFYSQALLFESRTSPLAARRAFDDALDAVAPDLPVRYEPLSASLARSLGRERLAAAVFSGFAGLMLFLTLVAIVGVVARAVSERRREAGIRLALGATPGGLVRMMQREILLPVLTGLLLGGLLVWIGSRFLTSLLHGVVPMDGIAQIGAAALLLGAAFLASLVPARRILGLEPGSVVRSD